MMTKYLIRVKGAFIEPTLYDTNDLSTIRGGGLTLLYIHKKVNEFFEGQNIDYKTNHELFYKGASQCAFTFESDDCEFVKRELLKCFQEKGDIPFQHIIPVISIQEIKGQVVDALKKAEFEGAALTYQNWTVSPLKMIDKARNFDPLNYTYPTKGKLSQSVEARQNFGKKQKQKFYANALGVHSKNINFAHDFEELIKLDSANKSKLPLSLHNKTAVFYADGNGFSDVFKDARGKGDDAFKVASGKAENLRDSLLKDIMAWLIEKLDTKESHFYAYPKEGEETAFRFETILWGGDECAFVMPAWLAVEFAQKFFYWTKDWNINGKPLTNACGVAIAHVKVPIRQMRKIAKTVADAAKDAGLRDKNSVTFEIYESLHPPDEDFESFRKKSYSFEEQDDLAKHLAFDGSKFEEFVTAMQNIKDEDDGFPRSQIYKALQSPKPEEAIDKYKERMADKKNVILELPCFEKRPFGINLAIIANLWDYVEPFNGAQA